MSRADKEVDCRNCGSWQNLKRADQTYSCRDCGQEWIETGDLYKVTKLGNTSKNQKRREIMSYLDAIREYNVLMNEGKEKEAKELLLGLADYTPIEFHNVEEVEASKDLNTEEKALLVELLSSGQKKVWAVIDVIISEH